MVAISNPIKRSTQAPSLTELDMLRRLNRLHYSERFPDRRPQLDPLAGVGLPSGANDDRVLHEVAIKLLVYGA